MGWAARATGTERINRHVVGLLMVVTGIGSFAFHGCDGAPWQFLHDISFLITIWTIAVINVADYRRWDRPVGWGIVGVGVAVFSAALLIGPTLTNLLTGLVGAALVVSDLMIERSGLLNRTVWLVSLATMVGAVAVFLLGRTGGPLCDPDSVFQGHGVWHLLSATAITLYFVATSGARQNREAS